jgi:hypothetical protein
VVGVEFLEAAGWMGRGGGGGTWGEEVGGGREEVAAVVVDRKAAAEGIREAMVVRVA